MSVFNDDAWIALNRLLDAHPDINTRALVYAELVGRLSVLAPDALLQAVRETDRVDRAVVSPADASPASTRTESVTVQSGPVDADTQEGQR